MSLSDGLSNLRGVKYSFEEINGGSRFDMTEQFGHSGVKAYLYEKKYQSGDESIKDTKAYQQNLLAQSLGFTNYREMGEALKGGKLSKNDVLRKFRELDDAGHMNKDHFTVERQDSLKDKVKNIKKYSNPRTTFASRKDIQRKLLRNEIDSYAQKNGFVDENNNPDALLFLQAVESGDHRDGRAESLIEKYRSTFDTTGYANPDYGNFKDIHELIQGEYTMDDISDQILRRF